MNLPLLTMVWPPLRLRWHRLMIAGTLMSAVMACDAVKVPILNPHDSDEDPQMAAAEPPDTPSNSSDQRPQDTADLAAAPDPTPVNGTVSERASALPDALPAPPPVSGTISNATADRGAPAFLPISSLGSINAARCGLPANAEPTPTVSMRAQAVVEPQAESILSVQAVGAMTVQSLTGFPGIVKMEPRRFEGNAITSGHCAATRIAERWFLTAAHCVDDDYDEIQFIAGTANLRDRASARTFTADAAVCHSGYAGRETNFINDLALIHVPEEALPALITVPIAEFGVTDRPLGQYHYATADMAGWGMTGFNQPLSPRLLSAELSIVSASPSVIVIASREGSGPCIGDSGGPLYVTEDDGQRTVVGVLSVVEQTSGQNLCEGDYRGRYTNVAGYRDWITKVMGSCTLQPELCARTTAPSLENVVAPRQPAGGNRPR